MAREKHLEFIQGAINRMASNSFFIKGWFVTIIAAIIALSIKENDYRMYLVIFIPNTFFWWLDSYYLRQEKLFRELYNRVRVSENDLKFDMNTKPFAQSVDSIWKIMIFNNTIRFFYLPFYIVTIALTIIA